MKQIAAVFPRGGVSVKVKPDGLIDQSNKSPVALDISMYVFVYNVGGVSALRDRWSLRSASPIIVDSCGDGRDDGRDASRYVRMPIFDMNVATARNHVLGRARWNLFYGDFMLSLCRAPINSYRWACRSVVQIRLVLCGRIHQL